MILGRTLVAPKEQLQTLDRQCTYWKCQARPLSGSSAAQRRCSTSSSHGRQQGLHLPYAAAAVTAPESTAAPPTQQGEPSWAASDGQQGGGASLHDSLLTGICDATSSCAVSKLCAEAAAQHLLTAAPAPCTLHATTVLMYLICVRSQSLESTAFSTSRSLLRTSRRHASGCQLAVLWPL